MKYLLCVLVLFSFLFSRDQIKPLYKLQASGLVTDIKVYDNKLFASTELGSIEVFNLQSKDLVSKVSIPKVKDFLGDLFPSKIYSIDIYNDSILIVAQSNKGKRNLYIYKNNQLKLIKKFENKYVIRKALFINESQVLLGLISSEIILFDLIKDEVLYKKFTLDRGGYGSVFSNMRLSEDKKTLAIGDDSAVVSIFNTADFSLLYRLEGQNVNKIVDIDYKNNTVITAGKDRRCAVYKKHDEPYYKKGEFFIYTVALNPSASKGAYVGNFNNDIQVFDIKTEKDLFLLKGHHTIPTDFEFINDNELFSSDHDGQIFFWRL